MLGSEYYWSFIYGDSIRLTDKLVLLNSKFGYILNGPIERPSPAFDDKRIQSTNFCQNVILKQSEVGDDIVSFSESKKWEDKIDRFWELDSLGILPKEESIYDKFESDIKFVDNRYEVRLPFKENHSLIEDNYATSLIRLKSLKSKLEKTPELMKAYNEVIQQQIKDGIVEIISPDEKEPSPGEVTYLPHRAVLRKEKDTTSTRVVYDASAKSRNGPSLNECLYKGPCLTPLIFDELMKFRMHKIAITADIEKAYLQISVFPPHRDFLRFLWFTDIEDDDLRIVKLRFLRVIFGATSSQYLLNAVIRKHINRYAKEDPVFVQKLLDALYVDDLTSGSDTVSEGIELYEKCKKRFSEGNFNLRKWRTNSKELKEKIREKEGLSPKNHGKVLGLIWDEENDHLIMNFSDIGKKYEREEVTKRSILATVAGFFDPLGLAQPIVVQLKILFQESCKLQLKWNETVSEELSKKWTETITAIRNLGNLIVPRCYCYTEVFNPIESIEIVGFSDASF